MARLVPESWRHPVERLRHPVERLRHPVDQLRHPVERLREDVHHAFNRWLPQMRSRRGEEQGRYSRLVMYPGPSVDVEETEHEVMVYAELPGMEKNDFEIEVLGDQLFLRGEKKMPAEDAKQVYYYSECSYGPFIRRIPLPGEVNADQADAEYKQGILKISLPKLKQPDARKVTIKAS